MKGINRCRKKQGSLTHATRHLPWQHTKSNDCTRLARTLLASLIASAIAMPSLSYAQTFVASGPGLEVGPNRVMNGADLPEPGQDTNVAPDWGTQSGAIQAIAINPFNPSLWLVGSPNGGIFRSVDGGQHWTPTTDNKASLSIGGISFDPTDATGMTVVAGVAVVSSGSTDPTLRLRGGVTNQGLLYSTDGGSSWNHIGQGSLPDVSFLNVTARGSVIMAAGFEETRTNGDKTGLYRSTNGGKTFSRVDQVAGSGLPPGPTSALVGDPKDPHRFYVAVTGTSNTSVYSSTDNGATWHPIFTAANANGSINADTKTYLRLASGPGGSVLVGVISSKADGASSQLSNAFLSQNYGESWTDLSTALDQAAVSSGGEVKGSKSPAQRLNEALAGYDPSNPSMLVNPGLQGLLHSVVAIDPNDPNVIYMAGDRVGEFPGPTGAPSWSAAVVRVTVNPDGSLSYAPMTDNFTVDHSTIHPDCRAIAFDANGNLIMGTDGGVYYRTNPSSTDGYWRGLNDGRQTLEVTTAGLDPNSGLIVVAAQDNGVAIQDGKNRSLYTVVKGGDGTVASVNAQSTPGFSYMYTATQYLGGPSRYKIDAQGDLVGDGPTYLLFRRDAGGVFKLGTNGFVDFSSETVSFVPAFKLNNIDKSLMAIGVKPGVLVSQDGFITPDQQNGSLSYRILQSYFAGLTGWATALDFGTQDNTYALLAGTYTYMAPNADKAARLFVSTGTSLDTLNMQPVLSYPVAKNTPSAVLFDPRTQDRFFAASPTADDTGYLWGTIDGGAEGIDLTGNLPAYFIRPTSLGFISSNGVNALLVGGLNNRDDAGNPLVVADSDADGTLSHWRRFGDGLPNATVTVIDYEAGLDAMLIGTYGRGTFTLYDVTSYFPQADVLQFGLANNDSTPDVSLLAGDRPLAKYGSGTLTINGNAPYTGGTTVEVGGLMLNGSVKNDLKLASAGTLYGGGSIGGTLHVEGGTVVPGGSTGTTLTVGALDNTGGGNLQFQYNPFMSGVNTSLAVTGSADITGMMVWFKPLAGDSASQFYRRYNLLSAGSLSGTFANASTQWASVPVDPIVLTEGGSSLLSLQQRVNYSLAPNSVVLETIQPIDWTSDTNNPNQWAVGHALNALQYTGTSAFLAALNDVGTGYVPGNLQAISGQNSVAAFQTVGLIADRFLSTISHQMTASPGCGANVRPANAGHDLQTVGCQALGKDVGEHRFWAEAMNVNTSLHGTYDPNYFSGGGIAAGLEISLGEHAKIGGSLGYANVSMQASSQSPKTRSRQGMAAVYGDYHYGPWYVGGMLSQSMGSDRLDRTFQVGGGGMQSVYAKPDASSTGLRLITGFNLPIANSWYASPYGTLTRTWSSQDAYTESGDSPLALSYSSVRQNGFQGELGVNVGKLFQSDKVVMEPYLGVAQVFAWGGRTPYAKVSFVGAPGTSFIVQGNSLPSSWTKAQGGLRLALGRGILFDVSYQSNLNSQLRNDQFNASVSWQF